MCILPLYVLKSPLIEDPSAAGFGEDEVIVLISGFSKHSFLEVMPSVLEDDPVSVAVILVDTDPVVVISALVVEFCNNPAAVVLMAAMEVFNFTAVVTLSAGIVGTPVGVDNLSDGLDFVCTFAVDDPMEQFMFPLLVECKLSDDFDFGCTLDLVVEDPTGMLTFALLVEYKLSDDFDFICTCTLEAVSP